MNALSFCGLFSVTTTTGVTSLEDSGTCEIRICSNGKEAYDGGSGSNFGSALLILCRTLDEADKNVICSVN